MRKFAKPLLLILALALALGMFMNVSAAGDVPVEEGGDVPPAETPIPDPTMDPVPEPTPAPTTNPGTVDLTVYAYSGGVAAQGYTVRIDSTDQKTSSEGKAVFPQLTVEQHSIQLISPGGSSSSGTLYMSRGGSTTITDKAMGGKYGLDIGEGVTSIYMNAAFNSEGVIDITTLSSSPISPPPAPSATANPSQSANASASPGESASAAASASSGGGMSTAMIGLIAMIIIVAIGVTVIVVAVRRHGRRRREEKAMARARAREDREREEVDIEPPTPSTGGANKFEELPRNAPRRLNNNENEPEERTPETAKPKVKAKDRSRL